MDNFKCNENDGDNQSSIGKVAAFQNQQELLEVRNKIAETEAEIAETKAKLKKAEEEGNNDMALAWLTGLNILRQKEILLLNQQQQQAPPNTLQHAPVLAQIPEDLNEPCFNTVDESASNICKRHRDYYECFGLPVSTDTFIPNHRIRELLQFHQAIDLCSYDVRKLELQLAKSLRSFHRWQGVSGGSETKVNDSNSSEVLKLITSRVKKDGIGVCSTVPDFALILAKQSTKPEQYISYNKYFILCTEAKGRDASAFICLVQGFEIAADSAAHIWRSGLKSEDVVVPLMLSFSDCIQFYAVYLIPECYPVVVTLSPSFSCVTLDGRLQIARWIISLSDFAEKTIEILEARRKVVERKVGLYIDHFFFKPLRDSHKLNPDENQSFCSTLYRTSAESLMSIYRLIYDIEESKNLFLFPIGVLAYPISSSRAYREKIRHILDHCINRYFSKFKEMIKTNGTVVVAFPLLREEDGWTNSKPPTEFAQDYINQLTRAVEILNSAKVAHMDLRPANIMWRITYNRSGVEMKIIDLEDAVIFGYFVRLQNQLKYDCRYPIPISAGEEELIEASEVHNIWFLQTISAWVLDDSNLGYMNFMQEHGTRFKEEFFRKK